MNTVLTLLLGAVVVLACGPARADTVVLRTNAVVAAGAAVRVADIADVQGEQASVIGAVVVADAASAGVQSGTADFTSIDIAAVRRALAGTKGVNLGRIALSGSAVRVRFGTQEPTGLQVSAAQPEPSGETLGGVLPAALARWFGVAENDIQVDTKAVDPKVLATGLEGRTYAVSTSSRGDVLPVQVRVFEGDRAVLTETLRIAIKVRRTACVATRDFKRGEVIGAVDFHAEDAWVSAASAPAESDGVSGATARTAIKAGSVIEDRQVDHPPTVRRGDLVSVDCISGSVLLRATMRAKQDGRAGELIWLEPVAKARPNRTVKSASSRPAVETGPVRARISGPGHAVTVATDAGTGVAEEGEQTPEDPGRRSDAGQRGSGSASVGTVDVRRLATGQ